MKPQVSILISSHERTPLLRRALWGIAYRPPSVPFEVVLADDGSHEDVLGLLKRFSSRFAWQFISVDVSAWEARTGIKRYFNNPALTNNVALRAAGGDLVYLMGNEVIAWGNVFDRLREQAPRGDRWVVFSTTYDVQQPHLDRLDAHGSNLTQHIVSQCEATPLHSAAYRSDVTNYLSLCPRALWEKIGGYDERYLGGIACEDSDFVRRARAAGAQTVISDGVSLHQYHGGKTMYYEPRPEVVSQERWNEGVKKNRELFHAWEGGCRNPQPWPWGTFGVGKVITNLR